MWCTRCAGLDLQLEHLHDPAGDETHRHRHLPSTGAHAQESRDLSSFLLTEDTNSPVAPQKWLLATGFRVE